jgi:hypothetical protein
MLPPDQSDALVSMSSLHFRCENSNGKLDTNFVGIPREGVGASNDAKGHFGPPKFDADASRFPGSRSTIYWRCIWTRALYSIGHSASLAG